MSREIGKSAEDAAARYLTSRGYILLQRNYAIYGAEVDIIAADRGYIAFVEVRYRASLHPLSPRESVTTAKRRRICAAALVWLQQNGLQDANVRFDIVEVSPLGITLLRAAFLFTE